MKKAIIYLLLAVMLLTALTACGGGNATVTAKPTNTVTATVKPETTHSPNATATPKTTATAAPTGGVQP